MFLKNYISTLIQHEGRNDEFVGEMVVPTSVVNCFHTSRKDNLVHDPPRINVNLLNEEIFEKEDTFNVDKNKDDESNVYEYNSFNSSFKTDYLDGEYFSDNDDLDDFEDIGPMMFIVGILVLTSIVKMKMKLAVLFLPMRMITIQWFLIYMRMILMCILVTKSEMVI